MWLMCLQTLNQNPCDLLLHTLFRNVIIKVKDHPRVEVSVAVDVSELINDGVKQAHTSLRCQLLDYLFEYFITLFLQRLLLGVALVGTVLNVECYSVEYAGVNSLLPIDILFTLLQLVNYDLNNRFVIRLEVFFKIFSQIHEAEVVLVVRLVTRRQLDFVKSIDLEVLGEGIIELNTLWLCTQDDIS